MFQKYFFFLALPFLISVENHTKLGSNRNDNLLSAGEYKQIEIYCWCFGKIKTSEPRKTFYMSLCTTFAAVKPEDLMEPKFLLTTITKKSDIERLVGILQKGETGNVNEGVIEDSRIVILLRRESGEDVFFHTNNGSLLYKNLSYKINYNFNVIDEIANAANIKFMCPSNN